MTHSIILNHASKTIEISKTFYKASCIFESKEYMSLKRAKEDCPNYTVKVRTTKSKTMFDDITVEQIQAYYERRGDQQNLANLDALQENGMSVKQIRDWFINNNESIKNCKKKADLILAMVI